MNANDQQLVNALRGPVIMITIGVLFLMDKLTGFQFQQTWPILLIVVGVMALAGGGRRRGSIPGAGAPPPSAFPGNFPPDGFPSSEHPPTGERR